MQHPLIGKSYDPKLIDIPPEDEVASRAVALAQSGSPLMQISDTRVKQEMNARNVLNSSMTIQAIGAGRMSQAVPIAVEDQRNALAVRQANQLAINQAAEFNILPEQQKDLIEARGEVEADLIYERGEIELKLQTADADTRLSLVNRQGEIDDELQSARISSAQLLQQEKAQIDFSLIGAEGSVQMDLLSRRGQIDKILQDARITAEMDLLDRRGQIDAALQKADFAGRSVLLRQQGVIDRYLLVLKNESDMALVQERGRIEAAMQGADIAARKVMQNRQGEIDAALIGVRRDAEKILIHERGNVDLMLVDAEGKVQRGLQAQKSNIDKMLMDNRFGQERELLHQRDTYDKENQQAGFEIEKDLTVLRTAQTKAINDQIVEHQSRIQAEGGDISLANIQEQNDGARLLQNELGGINRQLQSLSHINDVDLSKERKILEGELLGQKAEIDKTLQGLVGSQALEQIGLRGENMEALARVEGDYKTLMATNAAAGQTFSSFSMAIGEILANPDIPSNEKQGLINHQMTLLKTAMTVIGAIGNIDLVSLMFPSTGGNPGPTPPPGESPGPGPGYYNAAFSGGPGEGGGFAGQGVDSYLSELFGMPGITYGGDHPSPEGSYPTAISYNPAVVERSGPASNPGPSR